MEETSFFSLLFTTVVSEMKSIERPEDSSGRIIVTRGWLLIVINKLKSKLIINSYY